MGSKKSLSKILRWATTLAWAALIFYLSTGRFGTPFSEWLLARVLELLHASVLPPTFAILSFLLRKSAHLTEYAVLCLLLYASFEDSDRMVWQPRLAVGCVLAAALYSLTDEFHQRFVPGRTASLVDCGIDTAGAVLGMLGVYGGDRFVQAKSTNTAASNASAPEKVNGVAGE